MITLTATQRLSRRKRPAVHFNPCHDEQERFCSGGGIVKSLWTVEAAKNYLDSNDADVGIFNRHSDLWTRGSDGDAKEHAYNTARRNPLLQRALQVEYFKSQYLPEQIDLYRVGPAHGGQGEVVSFFGNRKQAEAYQKRFGVESIYKYRSELNNIIPSRSGAGELWANVNEIRQIDLGANISTHSQPRLLPNYPSIHVRAQRVDPTRTQVLRDSFEREIRKRFNKLKAAIRTAVVDRDCFGFTNPAGFRVFADPEPPTFRNFDFPTTQAKKEAFMKWLRKQEELGILETMRIPQFGQATEEAWTDLFVKDSYQRGVQRARYEMGKAGYPVPALEGTGGIVASMSTPFHITRVGVAYSRAFDQLKNITQDMDSKISAILAQGLADGDNPIPLAKKILATIDGKGASEFGIFDSLGRFIPAERRARMLARTEIIRAHAYGTLQEALQWGAAGVTAEVEFVNAGFNVCPVCVGLQGKRYSIAEAWNILPVHPHCRCAWLIVPMEKK